MATLHHMSDTNRMHHMALQRTRCDLSVLVIPATLLVLTKRTAAGEDCCPGPRRVLPSGRLLTDQDGMDQMVRSID